MKCKWCEQELKEDDMFFVDRKYIQYPDRITGWVHKCCRLELQGLERMMRLKHPRSKIAKDIIERVKRRENNEIRKRWGHKII